MPEPLETPFIRVDILPDLAVARVNRSSLAFSTVDELVQTFTDVNRVLDAIGRRTHRLLVDTRAVTGRNDEEFEQAFAPLRVRMLSGFDRVAVLARSPIGRLQIKRHANADAMDWVEAFTDEAEAIAWLAER